MKLNQNQRAGKRYESLIGSKWLPQYFPESSILEGPWIQYQRTEDARPRFAQPDYIIPEEDTGLLWIFEVKLTHTDDARDQLLLLYGPLCAEIWPDMEQARIEVCKNLSNGTVAKKLPPRIRAPEDVFAMEEKPMYLWHRR